MKTIAQEYIVRLIQPRLTVLITSSSGSGDAIMAAAWVTPVSYNPPITAVAISPERFTYRVIMESGYYAINIMDYKYVYNVALAGSMSGYNVKDKFSRVGLTPKNGIKIPVKVVKEAIAVIECRVRDNMEIGDHNLILGDVIHAYVSRGFTIHWDMKQYKPILYVSDGHFMSIDENSIRRFEIL